MINNNLKAEMSRYNVSVTDLSNLLNCTEKTVRNKINGKSSFSIEEAFKIKKSFFPVMSLEYLFFSGSNTPKAS